jgi:hypothetical protein
MPDVGESTSDERVFGNFIALIAAIPNEAT